MKDGFTGERSIVLPPMTIEMEENDPLVSSLYITDIGYYPHAENHFRERNTPISEYVLIYCMEGEGWCSIEKERFQLKNNQYIILPARKPHAYGADKHHPWTIYWLHFTGEHASIYSEGQQQPQDITPTHNSRISERQLVFEEIFATLEHSTDCESLRYASSLLHYYLASMRYLRQYRRMTSEDSLSAPSQSVSNNVAAATIHYMKENVEKRLSLEQLARYTGYSPSHFSNLFRQQTGESPLACLNRLKIERACHLLLSTDMRVNQICHKVGLDDSYYFSRLFKQHTGLSPKQYRESNAKP